MAVPVRSFDEKLLGGLLARLDQRRTLGDRLVTRPARRQPRNLTALSQVTCDSLGVSW